MLKMLLVRACRDETGLSKPNCFLLFPLKLVREEVVVGVQSSVGRDPKLILKLLLSLLNHPANVSTVTANWLTRDIKFNRFN